MFHSHEVNKEAILFANWAYRTIHDAIVPYPHIIAAKSLSWRIQLPDAIKLICSTVEEGGKIVTEVQQPALSTKTLKPRKFDAPLVAGSIPNCPPICVGLVTVKLHLIQL
jgi:hypothetical protein